MLKTVFDNQAELIKEMVTFYSGRNIDLDPTFSAGKFYRGTGIVPWSTSDITMGIDYRHLSWGDHSLGSIMFDPPFLASGLSREKHAAPPTGKVNQRFGWYRTVEELWNMYRDALIEFNRILRPGGVVYFKCQDLCTSGKQHWSHIEVYNFAKECGFIVEDLFILTTKSRLTDPRWKTQRHARKHHCYFWVFRKPT